MAFHLNYFSDRQYMHGANVLRGPYINMPACLSNLILCILFVHSCAAHMEAIQAKCNNKKALQTSKPNTLMLSCVIISTFLIFLFYVNIKIKIKVGSSAHYIASMHSISFPLCYKYIYHSSSPPRHIFLLQT